MLINAAIDQAAAVWPSVSEVLFIPRNDAEYDRLVEHSEWPARHSEKRRNTSAGIDVTYCGAADRKL